MSSEVLVVGAGPGGLAAAVQLTRLGVPVTWWDRAGTIGGLLRNAWRIENWPGMPVGISGEDACIRLAEHAAAFGLFPENVEVVGARETSQGVLVTTPRGESAFSRVIWAVGTAAKPWEPPAGSSVIPVVHEVVHVPGTARRVLVIGAGEAACDTALHLAHTDRQVTLVHRSLGLRATGRLAEAVLSCENVVRIQMAEVTGMEAGFCSVRDPSGMRQVPADVVVACCGRTGVLEKLVPGMVTGPLRVSPRMWVVGDARLGSLGQGCMALGDGLQAAMAIPGEGIRSGPDKL